MSRSVRPQGDPRRLCYYCGGKGSRTIIAGGYAHARCIPDYKPERPKKFDPQAHAQMCAGQITRRQREVLQTMSRFGTAIRVTRSGAWLGSRLLSNRTMSVLIKAQLLKLQATGMGIRVWVISEIGKLTLKASSSREGSST